jgi:predicted acyltransferase
MSLPDRPVIAASERRSVVQAATRNAAIDVFRGACVVLMVLVNSPGDATHTLSTLHHVTWNGWTVADAVAPSFLWIVGFVIPLGIARARSADVPRAVYQRKILARTLTLLVLGYIVFVSANFQFLFHEATISDFPLLDVLQRIGIYSGVVATTYLWFGRRGIIVLILASLAAYLIPLTIVAHQIGLQAALQRSTGFTIRTDHLLLGQRLNPGEPLIALFTSTVMTAIGLLFGERAGTQSGSKSSFGVLIGGGAICLVLGELLSGVLPLNRHTWSPSMVLLSAGICAMAYAALDLAARSALFVRITAPLSAFGRNALLFFALATILAGWAMQFGASRPDSEWVPYWTIAYRALLGTGLPPAAASHLVTILLIAFLWPLARELNRRRIYLRA